MATLQEITQGTGYQNGVPAGSLFDRWTYRGYTSIGNTFGMTIPNLPAFEFTNAAGTHLNNFQAEVQADASADQDEIYIWFEYTGSNVQEAGRTLERIFAANGTAGLNGMQIMAQNTAGNRVGHILAGRHNTNPQPRGFHGLLFLPVRGGVNPAGTTATITIQIKESTSSPGAFTARTTENQFNELLNLSDLTNWGILNTLGGGYEDFNFDLPTYINDDLFVLGNDIVNTDYVNGDPAINPLDGQPTSLLYKSGLFLPRFNTNAIDPATGLRPISNETNRADDRVIAVNQDGEIVLAEASSASSNFRVQGSVQQMDGTFVNGQEFDMVQEIFFDNNDFNIIDNRSSSGDPGQIEIKFRPTIPNPLQVVEEGGTPIDAVDLITFDNRHFTVVDNGSGDVEIVLTASAAGGGVGVRNTDTSVSTAQADLIVAGNGLTLAVSGTNDSIADISVTNPYTPLTYRNLSTTETEFTTNSFYRIANPGDTNTYNVAVPTVANSSAGDTLIITNSTSGAVINIEQAVASRVGNLPNNFRLSPNETLHLERTDLTGSAAGWNIVSSARRETFVEWRN